MKDEASRELTRDEGSTSLAQSRNTAEPVLRREGESWTIVFEGRLIRMRDRKGLRFLALLLANPGERIGAPRLSAIVDGREPGMGGLEGRTESEAARVRVTRAVLGAVRNIRKYDERLGLHLLTTLRTGGSCSYTPDARLPIRWRIEGSPDLSDAVLSGRDSAARR